MIINLLDGDTANISFSNKVKVSVQGDSDRSYKVIWYKKTSEDFEIVGQMDISTGTWGCYEFEDIEHWKIEFYDENNFVAEYDNDLKDKDVILIADVPFSKAGKSLDFDLLKNYCNEKVLQYNCNLKVYFEGSSRVDFSNLNFKPLRLNEEIKEMHYGLEKSF